MKGVVGVAFTAFLWDFLDAGTGYLDTRHGVAAPAYGFLFYFFFPFSPLTN